jgi:hypothetical protein
MPRSFKPEHEAQREYMGKWRERNREEYKAYLRDYYAKNKEAITEKKRAYYAKHRKELLAWSAAWAKANPKSRMASRAKYRAAHRDEINDKTRIARDRNLARHFYRNMLSRAKQRGVPFVLTHEMIAQMLLEARVCPVLGIPLNHTHIRAADDSPSFDCFYPKLGYVPGNVHVISRRANMIKHNATVAEIRKVLHWMEITSIVIHNNGVSNCEPDASTTSDSADAHCSDQTRRTCVVDRNVVGAGYREIKPVTPNRSRTRTTRE